MSKKKRWYHRWPVRIAALLLILLGVAAIVGAWRLDRTMGNLNQGRASLFGRRRRSAYR